jgi:hypothetical protein
MSESEPSPERLIPTREEVVNAYRMFVARGYTNPDDLPGDDPDVILANEMFYKWHGAAERSPAHLDPAEQLKHHLSASTVYVDAGFSDNDYLDEVANQWLADDLQQAAGLGLVELASRIRARQDDINASIEKRIVRANRERLIDAATETLGEEVVRGLISLDLGNQDLEWAIFAELVNAGFDEPEKFMPELE